MKNLNMPLSVLSDETFQKYIQTADRYKKFDRRRLPTPISYYSRQFNNLKIKSDRIIVKCCFHDDTTPSLSINLVDGYFRCFGCGAKGGDILAFHRLRYGLSFVDAVTELGAWHE